MLERLKQTVQHTVIYAAGNVATKAVGIVLLPIYTKSISVADYGVLGLFELIDILAGHILAVGLPQAFLRWHNMEETAFRRKCYVFTVLLALLLICVVALTATGLFRSNFSILLFGEPTYTELFVYLSITICFSLLSKIPLTLLRAQEKSLFYSAAIVSQVALSLLLNIYFVAFAGLGIKGVLLAQMISSAFLFVVLVPLLYNNIHPSFEFHELKAMLSFGAPFIFGLVAMSVLSIGDRYLLIELGGRSELGLYTLGYKFTNIIKVFLVDAFALALPVVGWQMVKENNQPQRFFSKTLTYLVFFLSWFGLGVSSYAKGIIQHLAQNPTYWSAASVVPILSLATVFVGIQRVFFFVLQIPQKTSIIALVIGIAAFFNIGLNILLIPRFGMMGATYATLASHIGATILFYFIAQKYYPCPYETGRVGMLLFTAIILYFVSLPLDTLPFILRVGSKFLVIASFPLLLRSLGFFEPIEIKKIKGSVKKWNSKALKFIHR